MRTGDVSDWSTVSYRTVQDTAIQGVDYTGIAGTTVTFGPDQRTASISFTLTGDRALEADETSMWSSTTPPATAHPSTMGPAS